MNRTTVFLIRCALCMLLPGTLLGQVPTESVFRDGFEQTSLFFSDCQAGAAPGCVTGNNANPGGTYQAA